MENNFRNPVFLAASPLCVAVALPIFYSTLIIMILSYFINFLKDDDDDDDDDDDFKSVFFFLSNLSQFILYYTVLL